jgi:hypothetical protein
MKKNKKKTEMKIVNMVNKVGNPTPIRFGFEGRKKLEKAFMFISYFLFVTLAFLLVLQGAKEDKENEKSNEIHVENPDRNSFPPFPSFNWAPRHGWEVR